MVKVLVKMDMHNVFKECEAGEEGLPRHANAKVVPFLRPLIAELIKKHPAWQFVTRGYGDRQGDGSYYSSRFTIMEHNDELGWVACSKHWRTGVESYEFNGPRMDAKRNRGSSTTTKDMKKALKLINADIYGRTIVERLAHAVRKASGDVSSMAYRRRNALERELAILNEPLLKCALANWQQFEAIAFLDPRHAKAAAELHEAHASHISASHVSGALAARTGATVLDLGNTLYVVPDRDSTEYRDYTLDTLPPRIKLGVAMLKLVEEGGLIADIGMRVEANTYYIMDGAPDEQQP